jgi:hypothetical protein
MFSPAKIHNKRSKYIHLNQCTHGLSRTFKGTEAVANVMTGVKNALVKLQLNTIERLSVPIDKHKEDLGRNVVILYLDNELPANSNKHKILSFFGKLTLEVFPSF